MGKEGKSHRKKSSGLKAEKRKKAEQKKKGVLEDAQARRNNPRAFSFQSSGQASVPLPSAHHTVETPAYKKFALLSCTVQAKAQRARTAEKEQRRLHGL